MGDVDFGSGIAKLSDPVFDPSDPFTQLAASAEDRTLVAMTSSTGFTYFSDEQQWLTNDPLRDKSGYDNIFSNPDSDGVRFHDESASELLSVTGTSTYPGRIKFEDVDLGDKGLYKLWRRVRLYVNDSYGGNPGLTYTINGTSGTVTGSDQGEGEFVFTLPNGLVSTKADLDIIVGGSSGDTVEPPIIVEFAERYRRN